MFHNFYLEKTQTTVGKQSFIRGVMKKPTIMHQRRATKHLSSTLLTPEIFFRCGFKMPVQSIVVVTAIQRLMDRFQHAFCLPIRHRKSVALLERKLKHL